MKAIGYVRVSTLYQADHGVSIQAQEAKIKAWCIANNYPLVDVFRDEGISGKAVNRPGFQNAMDAVGKGAALVSYSMSRLSRSTKDMLSIAEKLEARGADLVSLSERIDTSTASGKMVFRMMAVLSEFERDLVVERTTEALAHKKINNKKYAPVPYGYKEVNGSLVEVNREARVVREILKRREQGHTLRAIANDLNRRRVKAKKGGKWYASTIRYLIQRQAA